MPDRGNEHEYFVIGVVDDFNYTSVHSRIESSLIFTKKTSVWEACLSILASLVSLPFSWYFSRKWLENFALKTDISAWIYIISVLLVMLVCLGTILIQILKTARSNPMNSLRYE